MENQDLSNPIVYIFAYDHSDFRECVKGYDDKECHYIADDTFLRGRWPGVIKQTERSLHRHDYLGVIESIEIHEKLWSKEEVVKQQSDKESGYGV